MGHRVKSGCGAVAVLVAAVALNGCTSPPAGRVIEVREQSKVLFALARAPQASADALLSGPLTLNSDGCLGVGGDTFTAVVFPYGTRWMSPTEVRIDGKTSSIGDQVQLGGGVTDAGDPGTEELLAMVQRACPHVAGALFGS